LTKKKQCGIIFIILEKGKENKMPIFWKNKNEGYFVEKLIDPVPVLKEQEDKVTLFDFDKSKEGEKSDLERG
jgi:hypothetical protein